MKKKERKKERQKKRKKDISYPKLRREFGAIKTHGKWWNWLGNLFGNFFKSYYQVFRLRILPERNKRATKYLVQIFSKHVYSK